MEPDKQEESRRPWEATAGIALLFLSLYVLGVGPAACFYDRCPELLQTWLEGVYTPLEWLCENTPIGPPLMWYIQKWEP